MNLFHVAEIIGGKVLNFGAGIVRGHRVAWLEGGTTGANEV